MPDVLERAESGRVLTVFCEDVRLARPQLRTGAEELAEVPTLVALEWERAPALASELDEIRDALARAAASLWPNWYITAEQRFERTRSAECLVSQVIDEVAKTTTKPSMSWLREAWRLCTESKLPLVGRLTSAEQVRQLSRALDPRRLVFALSVASADTTPARVKGLARAAEWLAHESQAKTILLVPRAWQGEHELDHVAYQALTLTSDPLSDESLLPPTQAATPNLGVGASGAAAPDTTRQVTRDETVQVLVGPIIGKPHPASEVEQSLAAHLSSDPEIGTLFEYNQPLSAFEDKRYIADIVWRQGGLVIEVDGVEHCRRMQYNLDRQRDYGLYLSGYITLRVTNEEVLVSVTQVVNKIRNVVNCLKASRTAQVANGVST